MSKTSIEWATDSWNPIAAYDKETGKRGWFCTKVSEGCTNCYAETFNQFRGNGHLYRVPNLDKVRFELAPTLTDPLHWRKPRRVFVNSMTDLFLAEHTDEMIDKAFAVMALCPQHQFLVLTKRPERMYSYLRDRPSLRQIGDLDNISPLTTRQRVSLACLGITLDAHALNSRSTVGAGCVSNGDGQKVWPLPNVWLGVSVEHQAAADERIPLLLQTPAAVRFLSCEPLLGLVDLRAWLLEPAPQARTLLSRFYGADGFDETGSQPECDWQPRQPSAIDWIIAGGESGAGARPMHPFWAQGIRLQCQVARVPFFFKQWGAHVEIPFDENNPQRGPKTPDGNLGKLLPKNSEWLNLAGGQGFHGERVIRVQRTSKKKSGRLLDGRTWDEFPRVAP